MAEDFAGLPPRRPVASNKGNFGHVAIIAGSRGYHGAAVLSAWGALRAQAGSGLGLSAGKRVRVPSPRNFNRRWFMRGGPENRNPGIAPRFYLAPVWRRKMCPIR